jgi:hypothetical protein
MQKEKSGKITVIIQLCTLCAVFSAFAWGGQTPVAQATSYNFQTYNDPADPTFNQLLGINNAGTISGYYGSGATGHPNQGYLLTTPNTFTNENFPGSTQTQVTGINNVGTTVGFWTNSNLGTNFGFVDNKGTFTNVNDPAIGSTSTAINQLLGVNDSNIAVGFYLDGNGNSHSYTYTISTKAFTPITYTNAVSLTASAINNSNETAGFYTNAGGTTLGFLDNNGKFTSLNAPNASSTMFFGLNNNGLAVGQATIGSLTEGIVYNSVNFSWLELNDPLGVGTTTFNGINNSGSIVGFYTDGAGNTDGLLATPIAATPEPATWFLFGTGVVLMGAIALRRQNGGLLRS